MRLSEQVSKEIRDFFQLLENIKNSDDLTAMIFNINGDSYFLNKETVYNSFADDVRIDIDIETTTVQQAYFDYKGLYFKFTDISFGTFEEYNEKIKT